MPRPESSPPRSLGLRNLAFQRFDKLLLSEIQRARPKLKRLKRRYPNANEKDLAQRLIDHKKAYAGTGGVVTGFFGLIGLPADLVLVTYLQTSLIVELAILYRVNLKSRRGQAEVLELLGRGNGVGPLVRTGPTILARVALSILTRRGLPTLGRAFPIIAVPISAYLNNRDIQRVGDVVVRHYGAPLRLASKREQES